MIRILRLTKPFVASQHRNITSSYKLNEIFKVQNEKDFEERVLRSKQPVIVDFFATWCGPCKLLTPRIEKIIEENKGKISLAKVDIDELTELSLEYGIQSVPVLAVLKDGKVVTKSVGLQDTDKLRKFVEEAIKS